MPTISDSEIAVAARSAGFGQNDLATAVAVALAESGGNTTATNANLNGTTDYGLFQINEIHAAILKGGDWRNASDNARMAKAVYDNRASWDNTGWGAWSVFNSGRYLLYKERGNAAVRGIPTGSTDNRPSNSGLVGQLGLPVSNPLQPLLDLANPGYWRRLAIGVAGAVILGGALIALLMSTKAYTQLEEGATKVAKMVVTKGAVK